MRSRMVMIVVGVSALMASACDHGSARAAPAISLDGPVATAAAAPDAVCAPGPGKRVTRLAEVVIPAVDVDEYRVEDVDLAGTKVPGFMIPALHLPRQVVDAGCLVDHDAPGGCLGAAAITGVELPAVEIPGYQVPAVQGTDTAYEGATITGGRAEGSRAEGSRVDQTCQQTPTSGSTFVASVFRPGLFRSGLFRMALFRAGPFRPQLCVRSVCTASVSPPSFSLESVSVSSASIESQNLESHTIGSSLAKLLTNDRQTAYVTPADVLFDFDKATLKVDAVPTLRAIAADIAAKAPGAPVRVEGHSDDVGEPDYNQHLSEDRARAVAAWLTGEGKVPAGQVTTAGLGETTPAEPNKNADGSDNPTGRAANRRVVISTTSAPR
jgi:outer membrane protein OmpA-like peptidoglycan-associated protein